MNKRVKVVVVIFDFFNNIDGQGQSLWGDLLIFYEQGLLANDNYKVHNAKL